jgi:hypothetical protein
VAFVAALAASTGTHASAQESFLNRCGAAVHLDEGTGWISVPQGQISCPLAADPKAERSFVSYHADSSSTTGPGATRGTPGSDSSSRGCRVPDIRRESSVW